MRKLSEKENVVIRERLDYISERLYNSKDESVNDYWKDLYWSHNTIKSLLYKIYEMEGRSNERGTD